jgi:hypothetical protein
VRTDPNTGAQTLVSDHNLLVAGGDGLEVDPYNGTIYPGAISYGTNPAYVLEGRSRERRSERPHPG